jgi:hypothetical protein
MGQQTNKNKTLDDVGCHDGWMAIQRVYVNCRKKDNLRITLQGANL